MSKKLELLTETTRSIRESLSTAGVRNAPEVDRLDGAIFTCSVAVPNAPEQVRNAMYDALDSLLEKARKGAAARIALADARKAMAALEAL